MVATEPQEVPVTTETTASIRNAVTSNEFRVYDLDAVINHHRNGTGCHPGTNHSANTYKNQDGRHALCNLGADLIHHLIPGNAYTERDKCCDCSYHDQKRLCAVAEYAFSDGKDQEHCDDRCDRFRKSGQTFGPFFLSFICSFSF